LDVEQLEKRLKILEAENTKLKDIEEVRKLQYIYAVYLERGRFNEIHELFSANTEVPIENRGGFLIARKQGAEKMFGKKYHDLMWGGPRPDDYLHVTAPISGIIDIDPNGKTAHGRWYGLMFMNHNTTTAGANLEMGQYENDYIKEDGKWKILALRFYDIVRKKFEDGWEKIPMVTGLPGYDKLPDSKTNSPFGDQMPFHFKHPITAKEVKTV
jgi:hypothetical protein